MIKTFSIDNSAFETAIGCPRAYHYQQNCKRVTNSHREPLAFGQIWHQAMRMHYSRVDPNDILATITQLFEALPTQHLTHRTCDLMLRGYIAYRKQFPLKDERFLVKAREALPEDRYTVVSKSGVKVTPMLEIPFEYTLSSFAVVEGEPWEIKWKGRIDGIGQLKEDGSPCLIDHKTTSMLGASLFNSFELSNQFMGYCWAASQLLGTPVRKAIINVAAFRKPSKTGTEIEFQRHTLTFSNEQIEHWERNIHILAKQLITYQTLADEGNDFTASERAFPTFTRNCVGKYGTCEYFGTCTMPTSFRQSHLYSEQYKDNTWDCLATEEV